MKGSSVALAWSRWRWCCEGLPGIEGSSEGLPGMEGSAEGLPGMEGSIVVLAWRSWYWWRCEEVPDIEWGPCF